MNRENIFDRLNQYFNLDVEMRRINALFVSSFYYVIISPRKRISYCPEEIVDEWCIFDWKQRKNCINCNDMRYTLRIPDFNYVDHYSEDEVLTYLEYIENILFLCEEWRKSHSEIQTTDEYRMLRENLSAVLDTLDLEAICFEDEQQVFLKEKNGVINTILENVEDNIAIDIVRYKHHTLKGKLDEKRKILAYLALQFEKMRKQLKGMQCNVESDTGFLLDTFIRHNNDEKEYIKELAYYELESWYDKIYELILVCFMQNKYLDYKQEINVLKQEKSKKS